MCLRYGHERKETRPNLLEVLLNSPQKLYDLAFFRPGIRLRFFLLISVVCLHCSKAYIFSHICLKNSSLISYSVIALGLSPVCCK